MHFFPKALNPLSQRPDDTLLAKLFLFFLISTLVVPLELNLPMTSHLRSGKRCQTVVTIVVRILTFSIQQLKLNLSLLRSK